MPDSEIFNESADDKALLESIKTESAPPEVVPEAAPEPEAKPPETAAPAAESPKPPEPAQRMVPQQALHEARQEARALKERLAALEAPKEPELDETQDPIGTIGKLKQEINQFKQWQAAQAEEAALVQQIGTRMQSHRQVNPDFQEQYLFLQNSRVSELRALGHNDQSIGQQIRAEEMQLGRLAIQNDSDPGEMIANLAKIRGWQKAAAAPVAPASAPAAAPAVAAPAAPAPSLKEAQDRVERLERGQRAATTSSGSGGRADDTEELSIERIATLSGAALDKAWAKFERQARARGEWN